MVMETLKLQLFEVKAYFIYSYFNLVCPFKSVNCKLRDDELLFI